MRSFAAEIPRIREILAYAYSEPVGSARPPKYVSVRFVTKNKLNEKREGVALELQSTDAEKGWQFVQNSDGEIFLFSTLVSPKAVLKDEKGNLLHLLIFLAANNPSFRAEFELSS